MGRPRTIPIETKICPSCGMYVTKPNYDNLEVFCCDAVCSKKYLSRKMRKLNQELNPDRMTFETRTKLREARLDTGEGKSYAKLYSKHAHRVIAEQILGRPLLPGEVVHHEDENKRNYNPENLKIFNSQAEHARYHMLKRNDKSIVWKPRKYQKQAMQFIRDNPFSGLFLDMGLGKGSVAATVLKERMYNLDVLKPLIIGPKLVASHTWPSELGKWSHLKNITYSVITGTEKERIAALKKEAHVHIVSRDNLIWLVEYYGYKKWPFDYIIVDESSSFKNHRAKRTRALYHIVKKLKGMILLSGTPAPNGLIDLWAQIHLLDNGDRLYPNITTFRNEYFYQNKDGFGWSPRRKAEAEIFEAISDICLCIKSEGYIELPARVDIIKEIELDDYTEYRKFKRERVLELPEKEITAFNASALYTKLLQYANGAVYDSDRKYHTVNNAKLDALEEIVEELQGRPLLIAYQFQSDIERIMKRIPQTVLLTSDRQIEDWNKRRIPVLLAHAASKSEGLNLQDGGNYLAWYGIPASMQQYWQFIKRLHRSGQQQKVFNILLMIKGTPERKVYNGLLDKTLTNDRLFEALRKDDYREDQVASRQWL